MGPRPGSPADPNGKLAAPLAEEIARLELLRRLSMGAAHTLNNAFTAMLGETLCLLDERKSDPAVAEACTSIQHEIERSAKLTRSIAMRVQRRGSPIDESDVAALLRSVEPILRDTVSRAISIRCEPPARGLCVRGGSETLEMLLLLVAHRLVRGSVGGGELVVAVEASPSSVDVVLGLRADETAARVDESPVPEWEALVESASLALAERCGAVVIEDGPLARRLRLAAVPGD